MFSEPLILTRREIIKSPLTWAHLLHSAFECMKYSMHLGTNGRGKWVTIANWSELNLGKWARTCVDKAFIQNPMAGDCDQFRSLWTCWLHFNRTYQLWKDTYQKHSKLIPFHLEFSGIFERFTFKLWGLEMYFTIFCTERQNINSILGALQSLMLASPSKPPLLPLCLRAFWHLLIFFFSTILAYQ